LREIESKQQKPVQEINMQVQKIDVVKFKGNSFETVSDNVAVEKKLGIYINGKIKFTCMSLPGKDIELAAGLCFSSGLVSSMDDIDNIAVKGEERVDIDIKLKKQLFATESGIMHIFSSGSISGGKHTNMENSNVCSIPVTDKISPNEILRLHDDFEQRQSVFYETGGTHSAAVYDKNGKNIAFAEDTGRHNAFDKCAGSLLIDGCLGDAFVVILSSRLSYEMAAKACRAGVEILAGVSAPTLAAVDLSKKHNLTLAGFLRKGRFNLYSGESRIIFPD